MKTISILDTTVCDYNMGNAIIMNAIDEIMHSLFKDDFFIKLQYGENFGNKSLDYIQSSNYTFFGGTNSLSSKMNQYKQMGFRIRDINKIKNKLILFGLGWWQYQEKPNIYTRILLQNILRRDVLHSVRDEYTKKKLNSIGIKNIINTSCPTTWLLNENHCQSIPEKKANNVITTITDYNKNEKHDTDMFLQLLTDYENTYVWIQGLGDEKYLRNLLKNNYNKIKIIPPTLASYDGILNTQEVDYIGTRLHAGIRAIQKKKRTLILSIDNRAAEIAKDINLNSCERGNNKEIKEFILNNYKTDIKIKKQEIEEWKSQFYEKT